MGDWMELWISAASSPLSLTAPDFNFFLKFHLQMYQVMIIISELMSLRAEIISCQVNMDEKNH